MLVKRWMQGLAVCLLAVMMLGANDSGTRFSRLGHQMVCACGCGQILLECNHVSCPSSGPMINELHAQMAAGGSDTSIFNWFAAKYGATVLAAPIRGGFDNVAWIAPFAVFLFATLGTGILIYFWRRRSVLHPPPAGPAGILDADREAMRERIRRETEY
jgi:cytochrome c-type biogenesis protein CcmH/NrfF